MSEYQKLYVVEEPGGKQVSRLSTGKKFYTRLRNALNRIYKGSDRIVVEYELVPTGNIHTKKGM